MKKLFFFLTIIVLITLTNCSSNKDLKITKLPLPIKTISPIIDNLKIVINDKSLELSKKGTALFNSQKYNEALKLFDEAIKIDDNNYKAFCGKGFSLGFTGKYNEAHKNIDKSLEINPEYAYGYYTKAFVYKLKNDLDNSLKYFEYSIKYDNTNPWAFFGISTIYADRGIYDKSIEYLKEAIKLKPSVKKEANRQAHFDKMRNLKEFKELVENN